MPAQRLAVASERAGSGTAWVNSVRAVQAGPWLPLPFEGKKRACALVQVSVSALRPR